MRGRFSEGYILLEISREIEGRGGMQYLLLYRGGFFVVRLLIGFSYSLVLSFILPILRFAKVSDCKVSSSFYHVSSRVDFAAVSTMTV